MARPKSDKQRDDGNWPGYKKDNTFKPATFVDRELTAEEQAQCKAWEVDESAVFDGIHKLVEKGYKVTVRWDTRNQCAACWVIASEDSDNKGAVLPARGSTAWKAVKQALFKHHILFDEIWGADNLAKPLKIDD